MHTKSQHQPTSTYAPWKSRLIVLANWLVAIVTLRSVVHGFETYDSTVPMSIWCPMGAIILLTLTIVVNYTALVKRIRMWKRSSNGGSQIYIKPSKN